MSGTPFASSPALSRAVEPITDAAPRASKRRSLMRAVALAAAALLPLATAMPAAAQDKLVFLTSWYAQAEHGGFYQALATDLYKKHNLDVTIRMGGPQVNGMQLLMAGQADLIMGYDLQVLKSLEQGLPATTVAASFQKDLQGMLTHADVAGLSTLKDKTILVATSGRSTWWPWLRVKYGYTEEQAKPYTFNLQPFFADKNTVQQAYPSSEPFQALKQGVPHKFFLFADDGYPPYGTTIVTTQKVAAERKDAVARFVKASMEGWKSYLANPGPANELIKKDNPNMKDDQLEYAVKRLKELNVVGGGDAAKMGIGVITEPRWKATYDYMVSAGLLKADVDWKKAFMPEFTRDLKVMP